MSNAVPLSELPGAWAAPTAETAAAIRTALDPLARAGGEVFALHVDGIRVARATDWQARAADAFRAAADALVADIAGLVADVDAVTAALREQAERLERSAGAP